MDAPATRTWTGYVVPALVTLLLGLHFFLGFRGFDHVHGGLLGVLEAPGALLGWGGVILLAILLGWLIAGLIGRDLFGLQGAAGLVVRLVGVVALGLALAGVFGLAGGVAAGGEVGAGIGDLLGSSLGTLPAVALLLLMALPSLVLAMSPFFQIAPRRPPGAAPMDALAALEPKPGLYEGSSTSLTKTLYPLRRFDEDGNEIPMTFDGRDVGTIRYADEGPDPAELEAERRRGEPVDAVRDDQPLPEGVRFAGEPETGPEEEPGAEPVGEGDRRIPLPDGVRFAGESEAEPEEEPEAEPVAEDARRVPLPEGVRYADESPPPAEEAAAASRPPPADARPGVPAVAPAPVPPHAEPEVEGSAAMDQLGDEDRAARYRAKLAGSGIFDEPPPPPRPERKPPAKKKAAGKKKAVAKKKTAPKKKAAAKKKATPRKKAAAKRKAAAKKRAPKEKAASRKKKATAKRKAVAKERAAPKKKAVAKKKTRPKAPAPADEPPPPVETPPARKGAVAPGPEDETYRKAVAVAMERGAASSVLLSRRLGIGYAQARALIERLVADGVLGEMAPSGSRPLLLTEEEWARRNR